MGWSGRLRPGWNSNYTVAINNVSISDGASNTSSAIKVDATAYDVSVEVTYGNPATEGLKVYILGGIDGTNYELVADGAWGIQLEATVSTKHYKRFSIRGLDISDFKFHVTNDSGAQVTGVYVRYRKANMRQTV